jgi:hypothetical protein
MNSASLCNLAGRYDNPIPPRFVAPIDFLKIPALACRYNNLIPTYLLAPIDCLKIPAQVPDHPPTHSPLPTLPSPPSNAHEL